MARSFPFLRRRAAEHDSDATPRPADDDARGTQPRVDRRRLPRAGHLRRERRMLLREREERIRDLGGLVLEMYRREGFRDDLVLDQCAELVELEARLNDVNDLLAVIAGRPPLHLGRCECGVPLLFGAHFCANCGRPAGTTAVVACTSCGHALPADANFCALCGAAVEPEPWARPVLEAAPSEDSP
jgi:hypothetical protein